MPIPQHLKRCLAAGMNRKPHLLLQGIEAARPIHFIIGTRKSAPPDPNEPGGFQIAFHKLSINPLLFQPFMDGGRPFRPYLKEAVYFALILTILS